MDCQRRRSSSRTWCSTVSEVWRQHARRRTTASRPQVVPNGVDVDALLTARPRQGCAAALRGRRERRAAHPVPSAASSRARERHPGARLRASSKARRRGRPGARRHRRPLVPGPPCLPRAGSRPAARARSASSTTTCVLVGTVPDADIPPWYAAADVLAFPSVKEGFGLAVLEAMSAGIPVVTSDLPVFREYLVPGRDALLVEPGDVGGLATAPRWRRWRTTTFDSRSSAPGPRRRGTLHLGAERASAPRHLRRSAPLAWEDAWSG